MINSRSKGKRGELEWVHFLKAHGINARRGQQYAGGSDSPDVISDLALHFEVKRLEKLNIEKACEQATRDAKGKQWAVAHRRNKGQWRVTVDAKLFIELIRFFIEYNDF